MIYGLRIVAVIAFAFSIAGCSAMQSQNVPSTGVPAAPRHKKPQRFHGNDVGGGPGNRLQVNLGDAALPNGSRIQAIDLGIDQIFVTDANGNSTLVADYSTPQVVNVLNYQGGDTTAIGTGTVAPITYSSLTIVVDTATSNYVTANGAVKPLTFSMAGSKSTSGFGASTSTAPNDASSVAITFNQPFQVYGTQMNVDVDFNAMESILPGTYGGASRPSLTVAQEGFEGGIAGTVANASGVPVSNAVVVATRGDGTPAATGVTDQYGNFNLHTLLSGSYQLSVYNHYVTATGWTVNAANSDGTGAVMGPQAGVTPGQTTSVGTIQD